MKWIAVRDLGIKKGQKTHIWQVITTDENQFILGTVKWFGRWRKYCFFPALIDALVFEEDCLRDIANFLVEQTAEHRRNK